LNQDFEKVLLSEEEISKKVGEIAEQINRDYAGRDIFLIAILKGSFIFMGDLAKRLERPTYIDFMEVSSYGSAAMSSGDVKIIKDLRCSIFDKDVLIVEDIIDSGKTLNKLMKLLSARKPKSLKLCSLLTKPDRREVEIDIDYLGFSIPDEFVVGYGLDYNELYRNLPYIAVLKRSIYE